MIDVVPPLGPGVVVHREALHRRLDTGRPVVVTAPAGSGKTVLLRSWAATKPRVGWVRPSDDPPEFWTAVSQALRAAGATGVRPEHLLHDLTHLDAPLWLVLDDLHELRSEPVARQLGHVLLRAAPQLRVVLAGRSAPRLGLHRLRLDDRLVEIGPDDLRFTLDETRELLDRAGIHLPDPAVALLHERTEGWAAGLRLATLALADHPDPERYVDGFSGREPTVAEYLTSEVLDRTDPPTRRLLARTSVLEQVNGPLAALLTDDPAAGRTLAGLAAAHAFVTPVDPHHTWFRYHGLLADLLRSELHRTEPDRVPALHRAAAAWFAGNGHPVDAIRHTQAAGDWTGAGRLLADHWPALHLGGRAATVHTLIGAFPPGTVEADAELTVVAAADQLDRGSLESAARLLKQASGRVGPVPAERRAHAEMLLGVVRMLLARQRGNLEAVAGEVRELLIRAAEPAGTAPALGEDLRCLALVSLGITEVRSGRVTQGSTLLELGVARAHRAGHIYLEFSGLARQAVSRSVWSLSAASGQARQALDLARRHGWSDDPSAGAAAAVLANASAWRDRPGEAEPWARQAGATLREEAEPGTAIWIHFTRGVVDLAAGLTVDALAAFRLAERLGFLLDVRHPLAQTVRAHIVHTLVRLGEIEQAERAVNAMSAKDRRCDDIRLGIADLRLAQGDPGAARAALEPVLGHPLPISGQITLIRAQILESAARAALHDPEAADAARERARALAEPDGITLPFRLHLPDAAPPHPVLPAAGDLYEPLSPAEIRVLRHLPTHLTMTQIAQELHVSLNTVRTHMRRLYAKLGTHTRADSVDRARQLGLLTPDAPPGTTDR